ncbi:fumarylacetoacetase [Streptomyces tsukubensis]|uniref:fumarylacetoacetase n=1 Tax=Streptomyces tsukubensis TaxID=83656 RepID=A0A1V4AA34_9ACTN|nr:fumarylacetoacetase [Streptomyces tsukubensis]OON80022.1 fumarylacetoacetase [Streptomyces tsukubensis]QFR97252.1 fumarylacetoacetase [Streptomyces tsukubensis]
MTTWLDLASDDPFGVANLPYGVFAPPGGQPRVGVRIGGRVLDLAAVLRDSVFAAPSLNAFMARGRSEWTRVRALITESLSDERHRDAVEPHLHRLDEVRLSLPFEVADYVDFYASEHHATNLGRLLRPGTAPLTANWKHLPIGYHGRSGTVVVSGTPVRRPSGQIKDPDLDAPGFGPTRRLDIEAEVGFVVGAGSALGRPVTTAEFAHRVFGVCLVNDWSARDLQAWEYVPLGPFLGKSFATSVSPWIVPLDALGEAWTAPPARDPAPLPYLADAGEQGLDLALEVRLNDERVSAPPFAGMYWTGAQMLAHLTVNGASTRTGDLYASGTVSGPVPGEYGSFMEMTEAGRKPLPLADGTSRGFLLDGDEVTISGTAPGPGGIRLGLGEVSGRVLPPG